MPTITDPAPAKVRAELEKLRARLDETIPAKRLDENLLIATWNLRAFGGLTDKWTASTGDTPKRDLRSVRSIAEIISRFDVIAIQEVRGDIKALRNLLRVLGDQWSFTLTDVCKGKDGNDERMAFLFDTRRVRLSGLACELVLPPEWQGTALGPAATVRQFARTPYAVSFLSAGADYRQTFILVTLHVLFGKKAADRVGELDATARWLADWARDLKGFDQNLVCLGDFNIDRAGDPNYEAFVSTGLRPPKELEGLPRTIFDGEEGPKNFFDQIAWFNGEQGDHVKVPQLSLRYSGRASNFDFTKDLRASLTLEELSWKISDHYPLWCEFLVRDLPA
jgi:endonuclease/exonuclease/phosphatase family metal-dependent hydrolase